MAHVLRSRIKRLEDSLSRERLKNKLMEEKLSLYETKRIEFNITKLDFRPAKTENVTEKHLKTLEIPKLTKLSHSIIRRIA